jgi:hypothetical protein
MKMLENIMADLKQQIDDLFDALSQRNDDLLNLHQNYNILKKNKVILINL